jgi:hypothetical protein
MGSVGLRQYHRPLEVRPNRLRHRPLAAGVITTDLGEAASLFDEMRIETPLEEVPDPAAPEIDAGLNYC